MGMEGRVGEPHYENSGRGRQGMLPGSRSMYSINTFVMFCAIGIGCSHFLEVCAEVHIVGSDDGHLSPAHCVLYGQSSSIRGVVGWCSSGTSGRTSKKKIIQPRRAAGL